MLTQSQVLEAIQAGRESRTIDGRDYGRLSDFFTHQHLPVFGFELQPGVNKEEADAGVRPWTEESMKEYLVKDVEFGFEKALNKRGISASSMYEVVKMWMWVLEDTELARETDEDYPQYGLPFLKAVAIKYGLPNPIGDDAGDEDKYAAD